MPKTYSAPPQMTIDPNKKYTVVIDTNRGKITLDLFPKDAPKTGDFKDDCKDKSGTIIMHYRMWAPAKLPEEKVLGLIVWFHGMGGNEDGAGIAGSCIQHGAYIRQRQSRVAVDADLAQALQILCAVQADELGCLEPREHQLERVGAGS